MKHVGGSFFLGKEVDVCVSSCILPSKSHVVEFLKSLSVFEKVCLPVTPTTAGRWRGDAKRESLVSHEVFSELTSWRQITSLVESLFICLFVFYMSAKHTQPVMTSFKVTQHACVSLLMTGNFIWLPLSFFIFISCFETDIRVNPDYREGVVRGMHSVFPDKKRWTHRRVSGHCCVHSSDTLLLHGYIQ